MSMFIKGLNVTYIIEASSSYRTHESSVCKGELSNIQQYAYGRYIGWEKAICMSQKNMLVNLVFWDI